MFTKFEGLPAVGMAPLLKVQFRFCFSVLSYF